MERTTAGSLFTGCSSSTQNGAPIDFWGATLNFTRLSGWLASTIGAGSKNEEVALLGVAWYLLWG